MPRMMIVLIISHMFQLWRVASLCSGVDVPNTIPDLCRIGSLGAEAHHKHHCEAEEEHPSAEEEPVAIIEQILEPA